MAQGGYDLSNYQGPVIPDPNIFYQQGPPIQPYGAFQAEVEAAQAINRGGPLPMSPGLKDKHGMIHVWNQAMARHGHANYTNCDMTGNEDPEAWFGKPPGWVLETNDINIDVTKAVANPEKKEVRAKERAEYQATLAKLKTEGKVHPLTQVAVPPPPVENMPAPQELQPVTNAYLHSNFAGLFSFEDEDDPMEVAVRAGELE